MEQLKLLWELQELEQEIAKKEHDLQNLPGVKAYHTCKKEVDTLQETLRCQEEKVDAERKMLRRSELNLQDINAEIAGLNNKLYGGEIHSTRELENMEKKVSSRQAERSALEDNILAIMEKLENYELETTGIGRREREGRERLQRVKAQAQKELQAARRELAKFNERRDSLNKQIGPSLLQKYRELSGKMQGRCISLVQDNYCGICNVSLPSAFRARLLTPGQLVFCENCGSLLVLKDK